jgi:hypothetical protein
MSKMSPLILLLIIAGGVSLGLPIGLFSFEAAFPTRTAPRALVVWVWNGFCVNIVWNGLCVNIVALWLCRDVIWQTWNLKWLIQGQIWNRFAVGWLLPGVGWVYQNPRAALTNVRTYLVVPFIPTGAVPFISSIIDGQILACILFGNLMLPSYGANDLASLGIPAWQINGLAAVANLAVALAGAAMALWGWRFGRWGIVALLGVAALALAAPLVTPKSVFLPFSILELVVYGVSLGYAYYCVHPYTISLVRKKLRAEATITTTRWHLVGGIILGGIPSIPAWGWRVGEAALAVEVLVIAVVVAFFWSNRDVPTLQPPAPVNIRTLWREARVGAFNLGLGKMAWTALYLIPGLWILPPWELAWYAIIAQGATIFIGKSLDKVVEANKYPAAVISGMAMLGIIVIIALSPLIAPLWLGFGFAAIIFTLGETAGNVFFSAIDAVISLQPSGPRRQMAAGSVMFFTLGVGAFVLAGLEGLLEGFGLAHSVSVVLVCALVLPGALFVGLRLVLRLLKGELARPVKRAKWVATEQYEDDEVVVGSNNIHYRQAVRDTLGTNPVGDASGAWAIAKWAPTITYDSSEVIMGSNSITYAATRDNIVGIDPVGDTTGAWTVF